jgi:phosphoribosylformimino-5-aminoimidazole carboxamide ribotide isomerase
LDAALILIPAIDLKDGLCVRLAQGNFEQVTVYSRDPVEMAGKWHGKGAQRLHVIDLDGSKSGSPRNRQVIEEIVKQVDIPIELGGGIRDMATLDFYIGIGVQWVVLGTSAIRDEAFVKTACRNHPGRIILGLDARNGRVAVDGWTSETSLTAIEVAHRYQDQGIAAIVYTDISRDGMETGVNIEATKDLASAIHIPVIASGGISDIEDIINVMGAEAFGVIGVIIGMALYSGRLSFEEAMAQTLAPLHKGF